MASTALGATVSGSRVPELGALGNSMAATAAMEAVEAVEAAEAASRLSLDTAKSRVDHSRWFFRRRAHKLASTATLGPYRVLEALGQGGMGVVYRARHSLTERAVAVKTVRVPASRWIESIRREVEALTRIRHPGIVRILDHGVHEGRPWYAMELLEGESLRDFGARLWSPHRVASALQGPPRTLTATVALSMTDAAEPEGSSSAPPISGSRPVGSAPVAAGALRQVLALMRRVCATLAFLHGEGFVSCDLKPENVLLVGSKPVLIDFGLSRRFPGATGREELDLQRSMAGTAPYMSPEQLRGELVDARSDLYAVGCILYELLTGSPPFVGAPFAIRMQHLDAVPIAPSALVRDVPPALEELVLRLLLKAPKDRIGFADEVADALAQINGDEQRIEDYPPNRPYLYRPRFVGRDDVLEVLCKLRDRAAAGRGALALIAGESGVGKTRLVLELSRIGPSSGLCSIASESVSVAAQQLDFAAAAPLHAVRPLLRTIADRCQEGGAELTERLLGERRAVLAAYEPLLADVPAAEKLPPIVPLAPDASRQRLLRYLAQTLTAFAQMQPVLWVLDDLAWADDLSLAFFASLSAEYFHDAPALVVGTYRSEEATDGVRALASLPHVVQLTLPRLGVPEVSAMIADMLAMPVQNTALAAYVADAAEGNPFFVTEHVRTAVGERLVYRDRSNAWRIREGAGRAGYEALPLPRSLRELIDHRFQALTPEAQATVRVAAVLGRESETELVAEVSGLSREAAAAAFDELIRRQVLEQRSPERLRFAHDKLREVAYSGSPELLQSIHARAAQALERRWARQGDAVEGRWATLGHHFASADLPEPASRYLKRAADHARAGFANADAIQLYRHAIAQVEASLLAPAVAAEGGRRLLLELRESLGDVLAVGGQRLEARAAYSEALGQIAQSERAARSRLHRKLGCTWEGEGHHTRALDWYGLARQLLPAASAACAQEVLDEWMAARFDELRVNYWLARAAEIDALVRELEPVVQRHATPRQQAAFYQGQIFHHLGRDRYDVSEDTQALSETVLAVCGMDDGSDRAWAHFQRGFTLLLSRGPAAAEPALNTALQLAERAGDIVNQARAALYLAVAARMRNSCEEVAVRSARAAQLARDAGMRQYTAAAKAMDGWLCLQRRDLDGALRLMDQAIAEWRHYGGVFPFHWLAHVPRMEAQLERGSIACAVESCRALLDPAQRRLPAESRLLAAIGSWDAGDAAGTRAHLEAALQELAGHSLR